MGDFLKETFSFKVILSIILAIVFIGAYFAVRAFGKRYKEKHRDVTENNTGAHVALNIAQVVVLVIGVLVILQVNDINITAIAAGLGIASAIIGLALQDYLKDIIMGLHILSDHFYSVGEVVEFEGREGVIVGLTLKTTKIGDLDDHSITTVCNRDITHIRRLAERMDIDIPLSYGEDVKLVNETMKKLCKEVDKIESVKKVEYKGTQNFGESSISYRIRIFCEPPQRSDVKRATLGLAQNILADAGIEIPFNQLDVHCDITENK